MTGRFPQEPGTLRRETLEAVCRLARAHGLYGHDHKSIRRQAEETHAAILSFGLKAGEDFAVSFSGKEIWVGRHPLFAPRATYEAGWELASLLGQEPHTLLFRREVTSEALWSWASSLSDPAKRHTYTDPGGQIVHRSGMDSTSDGGPFSTWISGPSEAASTEELSRALGALREQARALYTRVLSEDYRLTAADKRIAILLVLATAEKQGLLAAPQVTSPDDDPGSRSFAVAMLAAAFANALGLSPEVSVDLTLSALLSGLGSMRLQSLSQSRDVPLERLPGASAMVLATLCPMKEETLPRMVMAYEAAWLFQRELGPVYRGVRPATRGGGLLMVARAYVDALAEGATREDAILRASGERLSGKDKIALRLLASVVNALPHGTVVELSTGEVGEILAPESADGSPAVRLSTDVGGELLEPPVDTTLRLLERQGSVRVKRVLGIDAWKQKNSTRTEPSGKSPRWSIPSIRPVAMSLLPMSPQDPDDWLRITSDVAKGGPQGFSDDSGVFRTERTTETAEERGVSGLMADTPLIHLVAHVFDRLVSGTLELTESDGRRHLVYFLGGAPSKIRTGHSVALLGEEAVKVGLVSKEAVDRALEKAKHQGIPLGQALIQVGELSQESLSALLRSQLEQKLASLTNLPPDARYQLHRGKNLLDDFGGAELTPWHPLDAILRMARRWHDRARMFAALLRVGGEPLAVREDADLSMLSLSRDERAALEVLEKERLSFSKLLQKKIAEDDVVVPLVYALSVTRQVSVGAARGAPMRLGATEARGSMGDRLESWGAISLRPPPPSPS